MNPIIVTVAVALVAFAFVLAPLLRRGSRTADGGSRATALTRRARLNTVDDQRPDAGEELELDRAMGKVTQGDYDQLASRLPVAPTASDEDAERAIEAARTPRVRCADCGERPEPGASYCSTCGMRIGSCPSCGMLQLSPDAAFCAECGAALRA